MGKLFGTDGIRGVANVPPMTAEMALAVGRAAAHICKRHAKRHRIVIGKDTRLSGYMIENALTAGICSMGVDVLLVGPLPTPGIAFVTLNMRADAGIVVSASHNAYHDNGIKIFTEQGTKLSFDMEKEIEQIIESGQIDDIRPTEADVGKAYRIDDALGRYIVFCKNSIADELTLEGLKIVIDCANGATYKAAPAVFSELGAEVTAIHCKPDGKNINDGCGSQFTADLAAKVLEEGADVGFAFDGDGDRLIAVDEQGQELTGDHLLTICARELKRQGRLRNNLVVLTPMSNLGVRLAFKRLGIDHLDADVGDRNVLELMQQKDAVLGGEQSGHMIFTDCHTTGDGIVSALQVLAAMRRSGSPISELAKVLTIAPQKLVNVRVARKPPLEDVPALKRAIEQAEAELGEEGRVLVRYSGTEPLCRVMVEGPTEEITARIADTIADIVSKELG